MRVLSNTSRIYHSRSFRLPGQRHLGIGKFAMVRMTGRTTKATRQARVMGMAFRHLGKGKCHQQSTAVKEKRNPLGLCMDADYDRYPAQWETKKTNDELGWACQIHTQRTTSTRLNGAGRSNRADVGAPSLSIGRTRIIPKAHTVKRSKMRP